MIFTTPGADLKTEDGSLTLPRYAIPATFLLSTARANAEPTTLAPPYRAMMVFVHARDYLRAAGFILEAGRLGRLKEFAAETGLAPTAPAASLVAFSIELFLKSYLQIIDIDPMSLGKRKGHDLSRLASYMKPKDFQLWHQEFSKFEGQGHIAEHVFRSILERMSRTFEAWRYAYEPKELQFQFTSGYAVSKSLEYLLEPVLAPKIPNET